MGAAEEAGMLEPEEKSFWKRHGLLIKMIALLLVAVLIVLVTLFVNLVMNKDDHVCKTGICVKTSADILKYIDQTKSPCEDFNSFVCGNYEKNSKELVQPTPTELLNSIIVENGRWTDPPEFTTLQRFYKACMNTDNIDKDKDLTLLQTLKKLGRWPILQGENWDGRDYYWVNFMEQARRLGLNFEWLLEFRIYQDSDNTSINYLMIDVPRSLKAVGENVWNARRDLIKDIALYLGAPNISHFEANATVDYENKLAMIVDTFHSERDNESPRLITIKQVQALCPNINWLDFIHNITGLELHQSDMVIFNIEEYIYELNKFLQGIPKRLQVDYFMWKIVEDIWPFLGKQIRNRFQLYYNKIGTTDLVEFNRQKFCIEESKRQFPLVGESVFIHRIVHTDKKEHVSDLVEHIRKQMIEFLEDVTWLNGEAQRSAINTIYHVKVLPGGPQELFDKLRFYQDVGLSRFKFKSFNVIEMLEERNLRRFQHRFAHIGLGIDENMMEFYKETINIANFTIANDDAIVIPAALLQDTIYNSRLPNYMNYATLGKVIAREMFKLVFETNNTVPNYWWNVDSFETTIKCLFDQDNTTLIGSPSDLDLAEIVTPDIAHDAYMEWSKHHPEEYGMPGLHFTIHQLFWIQASRYLCTGKRGDFDNSRYKIEGPLKNSPNFAKEFNCVRGIAMDPEQKCRLL